MTIKHQVTLADGWVQVAVAADSLVYVDNAGKTDIFVAFDTLAPTATTGYHKLAPNNALERFAAGDVYVRTSSKDAAVVMVSK